MLRILLPRFVKNIQEKLILYILFISSILLLTSCDLFTTRTPSAPDLGSTFIWTPASTPNTLLENFKGTIEVFDAANFTKCFFSAKDTAVSGEQFIYSFTPRSGLDAASRSIFDLWNIQSEQSFMTKLKSSLVANPRSTITFSNTQIDQSNSNSARITTDYLILLPSQSNSSIPASISGSMILQVVLVTTEQATKEWRIVNWSDFAPSSGNSKTFTDLKVQLSS
jgi:hypothetical protein